MIFVYFIQNNQLDPLPYTSLELTYARTSQLATPPTQLNIINI